MNWLRPRCTLRRHVGRWVLILANPGRLFDLLWRRLPADRDLPAGLRAMPGIVVVREELPAAQGADSRRDVPCGLHTTECRRFRARLGLPARRWMGPRQSVAGRGFRGWRVNLHGANKCRAARALIGVGDSHWLGVPGPHAGRKVQLFRNRLRVGSSTAGASRRWRSSLHAPECTCNSNPTVCPSADEAVNITLVRVPSIDSAHPLYRPCAETR